jgi:ribosome biogenesis GTPase
VTEAEGPGVVVRQDARGCLVRAADGRELFCSVRGKVRLAGSTHSTTTLAVGDRVVCRAGTDGQGAIEAVLPRTSVLSRPDPHRVRLQHVLAANVDRVVVVASAAEPAFAPGFIDRVLAFAEWARLDALIVVNKMDLVAAPPPEVETYRRMGYAVILTSATTGAGIDELRAALVGKASVVTGHSGVGKSSLLNALAPGLGLTVGQVNDISGRGRQTTSAATWTPIAGGGALVDTPGVREFGLFNVPPREVTRLFRDLAEVATTCKYGNCLHQGEPGCGLEAALEAGDVAPWRVDSYRRILSTLSDVKPWEFGT